MSRENLQYCTLIVIQLGKNLHRTLLGIYTDAAKRLTYLHPSIIVTLLLLWFMHLCDGSHRNHLYSQA